METTQYPYSLKYSIATLVLMIVFITLLLVNVLVTNSLLSWAIFSVFALIFLLMFALVTVRRLLPALRGDIALQLDSEGISDYIRNVSINWVDIDEISLIRGRSSALVKIGLKFVSDYGSFITISLRWVKGNDDDVYDTICNYYQYYPDTDAEPEV
jgi:hypothetical protein